MTYWLQQIVMVFVLLGLIVLLVLWPARHVLKPLWPVPVDEIILPAEADLGERILLLPGSYRLPERVEAVARSRPLSVVVAERRGQAPVLGFLTGYRETLDAPLAGQLPEALTCARVELPLKDEWVLVLNPADDEPIELPVTELVELYRPNQLSLAERLVLMLSRIMTHMRRA